ncbi:MAG TPA: hypothetical protein VKA08_09180 [Balneolales bacterium]|nr:hypothetical protein [Balneolales bacterium]
MSSHTSVNQREITRGATLDAHPVPSHIPGLLLLFLFALLLASCGLLGGKKKDHDLPGFDLYFFDYKTNTIQNILDGYFNVVGIAMYTHKE